MGNYSANNPNYGLKMAFFFFLIETVFILRSRLTFCFGNIPEVYGSISVSLELHRSLCLCSELLAGTQNQKVETLHFF